MVREKSFSGWAWIVLQARGVAKLNVRSEFGKSEVRYTVTINGKCALVQFLGRVLSIEVKGHNGVALVPVSKRQALLKLIGVAFRTSPVKLFKYLVRFINATARYGSSGFFAVARECVSDLIAFRNSYSIWIENYDFLVSDEKKIQEHLQRLNYQPMISIAMPVFNSNPAYLREAIESVRWQSYPNWELCIADDASTAPGVAAVLEGYRTDPRVKIAYRKVNGHISEASNTALSLALGEFVVLLDHDDTLSPHALYCVVAKLNEDSGLDLIYSDSDKIDSKARRSDPHFKPEWNEDLFLSFNLITHLACMRRDRILAIGGFRKGYEGSQDYDLFLRLVGSGARVGHIPHVLYHWRATMGSTALGLQAKSYAYASGKRAIEYFLSLRGVAAKVLSGCHGYYRMSYALPKAVPKVSVIVCTRDKLSLLHQAVEGVLNKTDYPKIELLIVDNQSHKEETLEYLRALSQDSWVQILKFDQPFNYSAMNNEAVGLASGELVLLLNNDVRVLSPGWLKEMVSLVTQPGVGAVGAKLHFGNGTLQHCGIVLGMGGVAGHPLHHLNSKTTRFMGRADAIQACSAVTGACLLVRKELFLRVGGLEANHLPIAFNDVDFCLRLSEAGYRTVFTPYAELVHEESVSRGVESPETSQRFKREHEYMFQRWGNSIANDPCFSPNLSLADELCGPAFPSRAPKPWEQTSR